MTKDELREKRKRAIESLNDIKAILGLDELYIDELEKENAELKDYRLTTVAKQQTEMSKYALNLEHKLSWYDDQLTKAKDHIKKLIEAIHIWDCKNLEEVEAEAEQFLRDSEVEK